MKEDAPKWVTTACRRGMAPELSQYYAGGVLVDRAT